MKIKPLYPVALCVGAGALLAGDALLAAILPADTSGAIFSQNKFDIFSFAVGLYFIGKGLFIHLLLGGLHEFRQRS